jgi:hypothetical protein
MTDALCRQHAANCDRIAAFLSVPSVAERAEREWAGLSSSGGGPRYDDAAPTATCVVPWCPRPARRGNTLCGAHDHRRTRHGDPLLCKVRRPGSNVRVLCREVGLDARGEAIVETVRFTREEGA